MATRDQLFQLQFKMSFQGSVFTQICCSLYEKGDFSLWSQTQKMFICFS